MIRVISAASAGRISLSFSMRIAGRKDKIADLNPSSCAKGGTSLEDLDRSAILFFSPAQFVPRTPPASSPGRCRIRA